MNLYASLAEANRLLLYREWALYGALFFNQYVNATVSNTSVETTHQKREDQCLPIYQKGT